MNAYIQTASVSSPTVREGLELNELKCGNANGSERVLTELNELNELNELPYKTMSDKIDIGDIVQDHNGQLMRRTAWGWDRSAN